jgi:hypothetical protein
MRDGPTRSPVRSVMKTAIPTRRSRRDTGDLKGRSNLSSPGFLFVIFIDPPVNNPQVPDPPPDLRIVPKADRIVTIPLLEANSPDARMT